MYFAFAPLSFTVVFRRWLLGLTPSVSPSALLPCTGHRSLNICSCLTFLDCVSPIILVPSLVAYFSLVNYLCASRIFLSFALYSKTFVKLVCLSERLFWELPLTTQFLFCFSNLFGFVVSTDTALASSRQAVSEGLTTSHQLANVEWKNKPVIQERPSKQTNHNNFMLDQVHTGALHKQELSPPHLQEEVLMTDKQNQEAASPTAGNTISTDNVSAMITHSMKLRDHSSVSSKLNGTSSTVKNDSTKKNLSDSDSHNEWFTNTSFIVKNNTISPKHRSTVKPYTAADYLQTLYPQLSVFKAPIEVDEKNLSSAQDSLKPSPYPLHSSSLRPRNGTLSKNTSSPSVDLATQDDNPESNKLSAEVQRRVQEALIMSLLKSSSKLGERSAVKQSLSMPNFISSASSLLTTRSKKPGQNVPGHRYLTEAGAKLLPAHLFSPLGSKFKDPLEPSPVPYTSSATSIQIKGSSQTKVKAPAIEPTQMGLIHSQTQSDAAKEPSTVPAINPTQSGMIPAVSPTKTPHAPTQSGFILTPPEPPKAFLPTAKPIPLQSRFISSSTENQGNNMWQKAHDVKGGLKRNKPTAPTIKHRLSSHEAQTSYKDQSEPRMSRFHENARLEDENHKSKPRVFISRVGADSFLAHPRQRRQLFPLVPLIQANDNSQQLSQSLLSLPDQLPGQQLLSNLPQLQQPVQQFLPTQPLQPLLPQLVPAPQALDPLQLIGQPGKNDLKIMFQGIFRQFYILYKDGS